MSKFYVFILFILSLLNAQAATLSGTVYGGPSPLANATVTVTIAGESEALLAVTTNSSGYYSVTVADNVYNLGVAAPSGSSFGSSTVNNLIISGSDVTQNIILMAGSKTLSGIVYDGNGQPLANVKLAVIDQISNVGITSIISAANGTFSVGLGAGTYKINLQDYNASILQAPMNYYIYDVAKDLNLSADVSININLPFATISGKTTDANGVPIPGVKISADKSWYSLFNGYSQYRNINSSTTSDANGNYNFIVIKGLSSETITPPLNSGFSLTTINGLNVQSNFLQNIILPLPDTATPVIIGKPLVTSITDSSAVVIWQTNESTNSVVSFGQGGNLDQSVVTSQFKRDHSVVLNNLTSDQLYSFRVAVSDKAGNGPVQSVIISFKTQITPDTSAPVIVEGPVINAITHNSAIVEWKTNEPATSEIAGHVSNTELKTNHSLKLTGLNSNNLYSIQAKSVDEHGNGPVISPSISFTTLQEPDTKPPVIIAGPMIVNVTQTKATIIWDTDEISVSGVSYNNGTSYFLVNDEELTKRHEVHLTDLTPGTLYNFVVSSTDALSNGPALSIQKSFYTLEQPDIEAPILTENIKIVGITHKSAVIQWETDEPSNAVIKYGTSSDNLNFQIADSTMKNKHNVQLTDLSENTMYYIKIESIDSTGNSSNSLTESFSTRGIPDTTPPSFISLPQIGKANKDKVVIILATNEPVEYQFFYGEGANRNLQKSDGEKKTRHQVILTNLQPNTTYGFKLVIKDVAGNETVFEGN